MGNFAPSWIASHGWLWHGHDLNSWSPKDEENTFLLLSSRVPEHHTFTSNCQTCWWWVQPKALIIGPTANDSYDAWQCSDAIFCGGFSSEALSNSLLLCRLCLMSFSRIIWNSHIVIFAFFLASVTILLTVWCVLIILYSEFCPLSCWLPIIMELTIDIHALLFEYKKYQSS